MSTQPLFKYQLINTTTTKLFDKKEQINQIIQKDKTHLFLLGFKHIYIASLLTTKLIGKIPNAHSSNVFNLIFYAVKYVK